MATEEKKDGDQIPKVNDEVKADDNKRYKLNSILGDGGYGTVFLTQDGDRQLAVKTEKYSKSMLHIEVKVLKEANASKAKHFCELVDYGSCKPDYVYMVITLLGKDLHKLRSEMADRKFSLCTSLRIAMQSLKSIEELHKIGYVSRDIKPGNYAPGKKENRQSKTIFMYDFGLARKYLDKQGNLIPSRKEVGWRGTTRYGSLAAHQRLDLGRKDDLESWLYMIVELTKGNLPWRLVTDRAAVQTAKQVARTTEKTKFFESCPPVFATILAAIDEMVFETTPEYDKLHKMLDDYREEKGIRLKEHWDWEEETSLSSSSNTMSSYSEKEQKAKKEVSKDK